MHIFKGHTTGSRSIPMYMCGLVHCFVSGHRILPFIISPLLLVETDEEDGDETSNGRGVLLVLVTLPLVEV